MTRFSQVFTAGAIAAILATSAQAQTQTASPLGTQGLLNGQSDRLNENSTMRAETSPWTQNQISTRTIDEAAPPRVTPANPIDDRARFPQMWNRGRATPVTEVNLTGGNYAAGSIIIDTQKQFLYVTQAGGRATRFPIVVGRAGFELRNTRFTVEEKMENPTWEAPAGYNKPNPFATPGPQNPLGVRGVYLAAGTGNSSDNYTVQNERYAIMIHGTNDGSRFNLPDGQRRASAGCIRLLNEDVIRFYNMVRSGAQVHVVNDPALMPRITPVSAANAGATPNVGPRI